MSAAASGPRVYEEGQDPKELFDLYEPPTPEEKAGAKVTQLRPAGRRKARALVHAEGDWHRWVLGWVFGVGWVDCRFVDYLQEAPSVWIGPTD